MKQPLFGKVFSGGMGAVVAPPFYTPLYGHLWEQDLGNVNTRFRFSHPWSVEGAFKNLYVEILHPVELPTHHGWPDITFTIYVNDVATDLTVTVPAHADPGADPPPAYSSSAQNTTDTAPIMPGDRVALGRGAGTITAGSNGFNVMIAWSLTFESANDGESGYAVSSYQHDRTQPFNPSGCSPLIGSPGFDASNDLTVNQPTEHSVISLEGSVTRLDVQIDVAPGAGAQRRFLIILNNVHQDGSGGTVDTNIVFGAADTSKFLAFTLPVSVLDTISIHQLAESGTMPAESMITCSIRVKATTDGQSMLAYDTGGAHAKDDGQTDYSISRGGGWAWTTIAAPTPTTQPLRFPLSEESMSMPGPIDSYALTNLCVNLNGVGPGTGKSYTYTTRKAFDDTPCVLTMSDADVLAVGSDAGGQFVSVADRLDVSAVASGSSPNAVTYSATWLVTEAVTPPIVSTSYPIRRLRRFALPFDQNKWIRISRVELIMQAGNGLSGTAATVQGYNPIVMFRLSRDGGATWDDELQMATGKIGEYTARAYLNRLGRARNPVVELTSSDPVFVSWIDFTVDYEEGTS